MRIRSCLILYLFFTSSIFAQQEELFDQEWYLSEIFLDGTYLEIPDNQELSAIPLEFIKATKTEGNRLNTDVCNWLNGTIHFSAEANTFTSDGFDQSLIVCNTVENIEIEVAYFDFFKGDITYEYEVLEEDDLMTLQIKKTTSDEVLTYANINLSTNIAGQEALALYPNPVKDKLSLRNVPEGSGIDIYSSNAKKILQTKFNYTALDVSGLENGLYFIVLNNENKKQVSKFLKE